MLESRQVTLEDLSLLVIDEIHHAVGMLLLLSLHLTAVAGKHPFAVLLGKFRELPNSRRPRLLGLTASPAAQFGLINTVTLKKFLKEWN
jgi:ERCC4-related helicase